MSTNIQDKGKLRVGVLRGGPSLEYDMSLLTGTSILKHMPERFVPVDIFISRDGVWHAGGVAKSPDRIFPHVDVVWNALHGKYGEDGKVQTILKTFGVPYTGSQTLPSAFGMNKHLSKALFQYHGFKTPEFAIVHPSDNTLFALVSLFQSTPQPSVVKPISGGSSIAVKRVTDFKAWKQAIEEVLREASAAVTEEYISGIEVNCAVLEGSNGSLYAFPPVAPSKGTQGVYTHMPQGNETASPSYLTDIDKHAIQKLAKEVHAQFGLRHYSSIDAILHPTRGLYLIEVDTLPSVAENALLPQALKKADISIEEFIDHVLTLALKTQSV